MFRLVAAAKRPDELLVVEQAPALVVLLGQELLAGLLLDLTATHPRTSISGPLLLRNFGRLVLGCIGAAFFAGR